MKEVIEQGFEALIEMMDAFHSGDEFDKQLIKDINGNHNTNTAS